MGTNSFKEKIRNLFYGFYYKRISDKNQANPTIFCNDCVGGFIYNQLNIPFSSPTINLRINHKDFLTLCLNLDNYINEPLNEIKTNNYVTGVLQNRNNDADSIKILFVHEKDFDEGKSKWDRRKKRIDRNNIFVVFDNTLLDEKLSKTDAFLFSKIPYKKIMLCRYDDKDIYADINDVFYISFHKKVKSATALSYIKGGYKRYFNQFNFVDWFNKGYKK